MADLQKLPSLINIISKLSLESLDTEWIKNVIDNDFTDVENLPLEFEDIHSTTNFPGLFNAIINTLRDTVDSIKSLPSSEVRRSSLSFLSTTSISEEDDKDTFSKFWVDLSHSFNMKSLLAFLFYYIHRGQRYDANEDVRELGIQASSLYFLLLSFPGSNAFRVFHPMLYIKALDILRLITKLNLAASSPKKGNQKNKVIHRRSTDDMDSIEDDEDGELSYLSPSEANKLIRSLNILLNDFLRLINKFSLKHSADSLEETINILVEVTRCEIHNAQGIFLNRPGANTTAALAYNAYVALQNICDPLHGNVNKNVLFIMKNLLNNVLMISRGSSDLSTRALGVIREHSVIFIKYIFIQLGKKSYDAIYILLQHLCLKVPDKADYRDKAAKSIIEILKVFPLNLYSKFMKWLFKFSHNEKAGHRLFTLEVISKLLYEDERQSDPSEEPAASSLSDVSFQNQGDESVENNSKLEDNAYLNSLSLDHDISTPNNRNILSHKFLLCIIFSRCRDSAASVRAKALSLLADCTLSENPAIMESMKQIFNQADLVVYNTPHISDNEINCESPSEEYWEEIKLPNLEVIMSLLKRRSLDDKVTVRKSSLQVMANLMKINKDMLSIDNLKVLVDHCRDPALFIRKQMVSSITSIVETYPKNDEVIETWASGILPLILDPEIKVQEKVVEHMNSLIFVRIHQYGTSADELPWRVLNAITKLSLHKFFRKVIMMWAKSEYKRPQIIATCKTHIGHEFNEPAWTLLALLSHHMSIKDLTFALDYFDANCNLTDEIGSYTLQQVLKVLCYSIKNIPADRAVVLRESLLNPIKNQTINIELISSVINTIALITYALEGEDENGQRSIESWAAPILVSCDKYLQAILFPKHPAPLSKEEEEIFFRNMFTLGEVAQFCPTKVNKRMFLMMQSIIFHQNHSKNLDDEDIRIPSSQTQSSQPPSVTFTPTRRLKALAVVTLGKMCLQHEDQAKRIIPALGRMLETTTLAAIKINIIFVLSDMCVRYATLVDPLMPQVTGCLRDNDVQVRRTTLTLLINLLQEDYLKLKGSFFYRILQCLTDDHEDIRSTVEFFMTERLMKRLPKLFQQHFIECIFHYNCYEEHESYNKFMQTKQEKELFSLAGAQHRNKRMDLYRFMLDHMPDDQRFATTQKLCQDVLGGVVDGRIKLTPSSLPMLEDTLMVLSSEEIKLAWLKQRPEENDQPTDQDEQKEMAGMVIKKTIISQDAWDKFKVVKRNVIENIVPILLALKQRLYEQKSPLMKQLLLYFKEIMKDYKNEVKETLAGDKKFLKEIEYDLRKLDEEQKELEDIKRREEAQSNKNKASLGTSPRLNREDKARNKINEDDIVDNKVKSPLREGRSPHHKTKSHNTALLKQALINSKKEANRKKRESILREMDENSDEEVPIDKATVGENSDKTQDKEDEQMQEKEHSLLNIVDKDRNSEEEESPSSDDLPAEDKEQHISASKSLINTSEGNICKKLSISLKRIDSSKTKVKIHQKHKERSPEEPKQNKRSNSEEPKQNKESSPEEPKQNKESSPEEPKQNKESSPEEPKQNKESSPEEPKQNKGRSPEEPKQNKGRSPKEPKQNKERSLEEPKKNKRSPKEPKQNKESSPEEPKQNKESSPKEPKQNKERSPEEPKKNKRSSSDEPKQNKGRSPKEPKQNKESSPEEPKQNKRSSPEEPKQNKESSPEEPIQNKESSPEEPKQNKRRSPKEPKQNKGRSPEEPKQNKGRSPKEPKQNKERSPEEPKQNLNQIKHDDLIRAISTPQFGKINNITFINKTQEISAIDLNTYETTTSEDLSGNETLAVRYDTYDPKTKESEFSMIRKGSKKNLVSQFSQASTKELKTESKNETSKKKVVESKRSGGGFMESYSEGTSAVSEETNVNSDNDDSVRFHHKTNKTTKTLLKAQKSKRSRDLATPSPKGKSFKKIKNKK